LRIKEQETRLTFQEHVDDDDDDDDDDDETGLPMSNTITPLHVCSFVCCILCHVLPNFLRRYILKIINVRTEVKESINILTLRFGYKI